MFFNISFANYSFSFKFNMTKIEYYISFYKNKIIINPSVISLYNNILIVCHTINKNNNKSEDIIYLPNIYEDKYFKFVEFFKINETLDFGVSIYLWTGKEVKIKLLDETGINYNNLNNF